MEEIKLNNKVGDKKEEVENMESLLNVEKVMAINPQYDEKEFLDSAKMDSNSAKVSETAFLRNFKYVVEEDKKIKEKNNYAIFAITASLMNILDRDSMLDNPNRGLYIDGLKELYKKIYKEETTWTPRVKKEQ